MTETSLSKYTQLHNALKGVPRHMLHQFCRKHGLHSWHCNADRNPNYSRWSQNER